MVILSLTFFLPVKLRSIDTAQGIFLMGMLLLCLAVIHDFVCSHMQQLPYVAKVELTQIAVLAFSFFGASAVLVASLHEIETAKQRQQQLAIENAALDRLNHLKSELLATISHEARTPLAVLASYAGLVAMQLRNQGVEVQTAADLDKISVEAKRVAGLIDRLATLPPHSGSSTEQVALDLAQLIIQTGELYRHILARGGVSLHFQIEDNLPHVPGNPEELTQVLFNLLQNASHHTHFGSVTIHAKTDQAFVSIAVCDTGQGIEPALLPHVFKRGVHGAAGGCGLGLAICQSIIQAHGGTINLVSTPQQGTQATFTLPLHKEDLAHEQLPRDHIFD